MEKLVRVLVVLLLIVLMIIAGYSQYANRTFFTEDAMASVLTPVGSFFSGVTDYVVRYIETLKLRGHLEMEYNKLRALNEQLMYRALFAEDLQYRNDYLVELLGEYNARFPMNPLYARVIAREPGNWFSEFTLNKGANDGVKTNMAVITSTGLVGSVKEVFPNNCKMITIIDSQFKIGAMIVSSRAQGVVGGTLGIDGQPLCRMYYLPSTSVPRPGDTVVTLGSLGEGLPFPRSLPIGTVRESTRSLEENKYYIVIEPLADFEHIEDVLILCYEPTVEVMLEGVEEEEQSIIAPPTVRPQPTPQDLTNATPQPLPNAPGRAQPTQEPRVPDDGGPPADDETPDPGGGGEQPG